MFRMKASSNAVTCQERVTKSVNILTLNNNETKVMNNHTQKGFSLIELLVVVVIIGVIASIGIPLFRKAKYAAENTSAMQTTRVISQAQISYFSQNSRYARLNELNTANADRFGVTVADTLRQGSFTFTMSPDYQTDSELKENYEFIVSRTTEVTQLPYVAKVTATGEIIQITP